MSDEPLLILKKQKPLPTVKPTAGEVNNTRAFSIESSEVCADILQ
jgi:hypothetical protein